MEPVPLAEQFHDLQLKQKERFKARVSKLQTKSINSCSTIPSDDLGLMTVTQEKISTHNASENTTGQYFGEKQQLQQTVDKLQTQIEQLQTEKVNLISQLRSAEKKVAGLQKALQEEREALGESNGGIVSTQKIVELSKKNRLLHAELAAERNRSRQIEKQIKAETALQQEQPPDTHEQDSKSAHDLLKTQLNILQQQLAQSKHKMTEYRNQCQLLKRDLKLAHKVIEKEVGSGTSVNALLTTGSGWRGRTQQIITLQNKLVEMKNLLDKTTNGGNNDIVMKSGTHGSSREGTGSGRVEARQRAALDKMERERKQNLEGVRRQLEKAETECTHLHKECSSLRARNRTLTNEIKLLRSSQRRPTSSRRNETDLSESTKLLESRSTVHALELKTDELVQTNQILKQQLRHCERELKIISRQNSSHQSTRTEALSLPSLLHQKPPTPHTKTNQVPIIRGAHKSLAVQHETSSLHEAQMMTRLAETERDKLLDLTTTLQQRLTYTTDQLVRLKLDRTSANYKLGKATLGNNSTTKRLVKSTSDSSSDKMVERLEIELAIQRDENIVLKETLAQLRHEKLEDMRLLQTMLQDTRRTCVEMMRSANKS